MNQCADGLTVSILSLPGAVEAENATWPATIMQFSSSPLSSTVTSTSQYPAGIPDTGTSKNLTPSSVYAGLSYLCGPAHVERHGVSRGNRNARQVQETNLAP